LTRIVLQGQPAPHIPRRRHFPGSIMTTPSPARLQIAPRVQRPHDRPPARPAKIKSDQGRDLSD